MFEQLLPLLGVAFAVLGALARCAQSLIDDQSKIFEIKRFVLHAIVSIFASILVILVGYNYNWSVFVILTCCGLAGWAGSKTIAVIKQTMSNYWGKHE